MSFGLYFGENVLNLAVRSNDKSGAGDAYHFLAIHVLFLQHAVSRRGFFVGISKEAEWKTVLLLKFLLGLGRVGRDSENFRTRLLDLLVTVAKLASFNGSPGSIGAREKVENYSFALQIL